MNSSQPKAVAFMVSVISLNIKRSVVGLGQSIVLISRAPE